MAENGEPEASDSLKGFGEVVKGFRERAGLTREEFALRVCCSKHTIISIEVGRRMPPPRFPEMADEALDADGIIVRAAKHLSRNPGLAAWFERWAELEAQAINLCTYECRVVPGLLQSEAYVRALFHGRVPPLSDEQIETQVAARIERQRLLRDRPNTAYSFVVEEAMFLRRTGGAEVTRQLIGHVLACAEMRNVELQVMPLVRETHAGLDGPVQLL